MAVLHWRDALPRSRRMEPRAHQQADSSAVTELHRLLGEFFDECERDGVGRLQGLPVVADATGVVSIRNSGAGPDRLRQHPALHHPEPHHLGLPAV